VDALGPVQSGKHTACGSERRACTRGLGDGSDGKKRANEEAGDRAVAGLCSSFMLVCLDISITCLQYALIYAPWQQSCCAVPRFA
jgi:hypothetical protein